MAVKTITINMAAYDALARRKRTGESFSDVINGHFGEGGTAADLLQAASRHPVAPEVAESIARVVGARRRSRARVPSLCLTSTS